MLAKQILKIGMIIAGWITSDITFQNKMEAYKIRNPINCPHLSIREHNSNLHEINV